MLTIHLSAEQVESLTHSLRVQEICNGEGNTKLDIMVDADLDPVFIMFPVDNLLLS